MLKILSQNLGLRIVLLSLGLALLLAFVVLGLVSQVFLHESKQRFWSEQRTTTVSIAHLIDDSLVRRREALTELSRFLHNGQELRQVSEIQRLLDERILLHRFFNGGLVLLDAKAEGLVDSPKLPDRVGTNYADRPHVQWVKKNLAPYVSHPFVGRKLQTPIFIINVPVL
ncbi:MAG: response regulator receiver protein, partial [Hydrogenovibrio sp.]|nr:response regulator receiver protein [Hydrogenovibrio sp.]